jgi:hypothetical protein
MIFHPMIGGGSAAGISVKAYAEESALPQTAASGALAVISSVGVGNVFVQNPEPSAPKAGDLWVSYKPNGELAVTAGGFLFSPQKAYQYIGGAWSPVVLKAFSDGAWITTVGNEVIYSPGNEYADITGGWVAGSSSTTISKTANNLQIAAGPATTAVKIDLTHYSAVKFSAQCLSGNATELGVGTSQTEFTAKISTSSNENNYVERTVPVSALNGEFYIIVYPKSSSSPTYVNGVELLA